MTILVSKYRKNLPQLSDEIFITVGGIETTLMFHKKVNLPYFASFDLLNSSQGQALLREEYQSYAAIAKKYKVSFILESATWRANADWGNKLDYSKEALAKSNMQAILLLNEIRDQFENESTKIVLAGCIGPRNDAYDAQQKMTVQEAEDYHKTQVITFAATNIDFITVGTLGYTAEAIGIVRAAKSQKLPIAISFTVEIDGKLPSGESLQEAIEKVDNATDKAPIYYMINCAHPNHFKHLFKHERWHDRIYGIRANASAKSHAELNNSTHLDEGNPQELAKQYIELKHLLTHLNIIGGCCGTNKHHIEELCKAFIYTRGI